MHTHRSQILAQVVPALRAAIRTKSLRPDCADDAFQEGMIALIPYLDKLAGMPEPERTAYVLHVGMQKAMSVRKRVGLEQARGTSEEARAWERDVARRSTTPEEILRAYEGAGRVAGALDELRPEERNVLLALDDDFSERATAEEAKVPAGSVGYLARKARETIWRAWLGTTSWAGRKRR